MNSNNELVEQVVAAVMQELADTDDVCSDGELQASATVVFSEKVITEEVLKSRISQAKSIHVNTAAILTPSALEFLRSNHIECHRLTQTANSASQLEPNSATRFRLVNSNTNDAAKRVVEDAISREETVWSEQLASNCREAAELAVSSICRGDANAVAVLATAATGVACFANRNKKVRAAAVVDARGVSLAKAEIGANLIAINPDGKSFFELRNMLKTFASGGLQNSPTNWD